MKKNKFQISESLASMLLGGLVVVLVGLLAYNFFKNRSVENTPEVPVETAGELTEPTTAVALPVTHTVVAGETLWSIAEKYYSSGYNYADIAKANNLANAGLVEVGQKLTIPKTEVRQPLTVNTQMQPQITGVAITGKSYKVVGGDNLWQIAVRAYGDGYKWVEIAKANSLAHPSIIHSGNVLTIPR